MPDVFKMRGTLTERTALILVLYSALLDTMRLSVIVPILPETARYYGLDASGISLLMLMLTLPGAFLTPIVGVWADRFGRKAVMMPGLILTVIGGCICAFAPSASFLFAGCLILGLSGSLLGIMHTTLVGDLYPSERRGSVMGQVGAAISIGTALYPVIGGLLGEMHRSLPFFTALFALPLIPLVFRLPNHQKNSRGLKLYIQASLRQLSRGDTLFFIIMTFACFVMLYGQIACVPILADRLYCAAPSEIGLLLASCSAGSAAVSFIYGRLIRHISKFVLMLAAGMLYCLSQSLLVIFPICFGASFFFILFLPVCLAGMSQGILFPIISAGLADLSEERNRGIIMAVNGSVIRLGQSAALMAFGVVLDFCGYTGAFAFGLLAAAAMTMFIFCRYPK
ncbi:MAG: MFS transporter [Desulfovibrionaceae bacterium]|nr:MFS transporter [Desulfovibrionaceae bacterium]